MHISELETILKLVTHKNFGDREGWGYQLKTDHYTIEAHVSSNDLLNEVWVTKRFPDSVEGDYIIEMLLGIFKSVGIFESVITKKDGSIIYIDNTQQTFVEVLREMSLEYPLISKKHNAWEYIGSEVYIDTDDLYNTNVVFKCRESRRYTKLFEQIVEDFKERCEKRGSEMFVQRDENLICMTNKP